jgi:hypothetical protein
MGELRGVLRRDVHQDVQVQAAGRRVLKNPDAAQGNTSQAEPVPGMLQEGDAEVMYLVHLNASTLAVYRDKPIQRFSDVARKVSSISYVFNGLRRKMVGRSKLAVHCG